MVRVHVQGSSMLPTLEAGDRLVALAGLSARPGDVVAVGDPRRPTRTLVKRVDGLEAGGGLRLAGDNPMASTDSRRFGPVAPSLVIGRVVWRYGPRHRRGPIRDPRAAHESCGRLSAMDQERLDHVLAPGWMGDPTTIAMEELRTRRAELQELEVTLSYQRRMTQGRLDIVAAERQRRSQGGPPPEPEAVVAHLTEILSPNTRGGGVGRLSQLLAPDPDGVETPDLDAIAGPATLASLPTMSEADLSQLIETLAELEASTSKCRRALHDRIDSLQREVVRRYRTGEASVETLLQ